MGAAVAPLAGTPVAGAAPGPGGAPPAADALDPTLHYAVVVGIDCYPALRNLRAARADARAFRQWLLDSGVPEQNIRLVLTEEIPTDARTAIPTRGLVDDALFDLHTAARARMKTNPGTLWPKSRLYVYLSGHGIATSARESMLLMANAQRGRYGDSFPCSKYLEYYEDVQFFNELVFLADCCRTGNQHVEPVGVPFDRDQQDLGQVKKLLALATGFGALAYEPGPTELEDPEDARGYFTRALLEGLSKEAVDPETGQINSVTLARYLKQRVMALTADKLPAPQQPLIVGEAATPIVFVQRAAVPKYPVTITLPAGFAGTAIVRDDKASDCDTRPASPGPWVVQLKDGLYEIVTPDGAPLPGNALFRVQGGPRDVTL